MKKISSLLITLGIIVGTLNIATFAAFPLFSDEDSFAEWYSSSAKKMFSHMIMTGYPDGSFQGKNAVSRAELAVILDRFASNIVGRELNEEPWACTAVVLPGLEIYLQDQSGNPISNATISTQPETQGFIEYTEGLYSGLEGEKRGYFTFTVNKDGYSSHIETIGLESGDCGVIPQKKTITLIAR